MADILDSIDSFDGGDDETTLVGEESQALSLSHDSHDPSDDAHDEQPGVYDDEDDADFSHSIHKAEESGAPISTTFTDLMDDIDVIGLDGEDASDDDDVHDEGMSGTLVGHDVDVSHHDDDSSMSHDEAQTLTSAIRTSAIATYVLLSAAHEGRAYKAMGYSTWRDYVKTEFDMSVQNSYRLLNVATVISEIEKVAPEGVHVKITQAQARDLRKELPAITEQIRCQTEGLNADEAIEAIDDIITDHRQQIRDNEQATVDEDQRLEEVDEEGDRHGFDDDATATLNAHDDTDRYDDDTIDAPVQETRRNTAMDDIDGAAYGEEPPLPDDDEDGLHSSLSRTDTNNLYDLVTVLSTVQTLTDPGHAAIIVPCDKRDEMAHMARQCRRYMDLFLEAMDHISSTLDEDNRVSSADPSQGDAPATRYDGTEYDDDAAETYGDESRDGTIPSPFSHDDSLHGNAVPPFEDELIDDDALSSIATDHESNEGDGKA